MLSRIMIPNNLFSVSVTGKIFLVDFDIISTKFTKVVYTNGSMSFSAYSDIYVYKFVKDFVNELPGFIQIKSLTLLPEPSNDYIGDITSGKLDTLVKAKLEFIWQDLQDIADNTTNKPNESVKSANTKAVGLMK